MRAVGVLVRVFRVCQRLKAYYEYLPCTETPSFTLHIILYNYTHRYIHTDDIAAAGERSFQNTFFIYMSRLISVSTRYTYSSRFRLSKRSLHFVGFGCEHGNTFGSNAAPI